MNNHPDRCKSCTFAQDSDWRPCAWSGTPPKGYKKWSDATWRCKGYRPKRGFRALDPAIVPYVHQHLNTCEAVGPLTHVFVAAGRTMTWFWSFWC